MEKNIEELRKQFLLNDEEFEEYYNQVLQDLISNKEKSKHKRLIIVGGQSGAGKTRLIPIANNQLNDNGVYVDFDNLRSLHPNFKEVSEKYIEKTHLILHPDVEKVKNRLMRYLMQNEYDVIYEGSLRNTQGFVDFSQEFLHAGYDINLYIMAVAELESFVSTYTRYADDLRAKSNPRWVEKIAHDEAFDGVLRTVKIFEEKGLCSDIKVFVRGNPEPKQIYSVQGRQFPTAIEAIKYGRHQGKKQALKDFKEKYTYVYRTFAVLKPELMHTLKDLEDLFSKENFEYLIKNQKQK